MKITLDYLFPATLHDPALRGDERVTLFDLLDALPADSGVSHALLQRHVHLGEFDCARVDVVRPVVGGRTRTCKTYSVTARDAAWLLAGLDSDFGRQCRHRMSAYIHNLELAAAALARERLDEAMTVIQGLAGGVGVDTFVCSIVDDIKGGRPVDDHAARAVLAFLTARNTYVDVAALAAEAV